MRQETAHARLLVALDGPRYSDLLAALATLIDDPPLNDAAILPALSEVDRLVQHSVRRVQRMAARADASAEGADRERALHDVRNAAKRARYAAESAVPVLGKRSTKLARRMKRLQDLLGGLQDSVGSRRLLREVGAVACLSHDEAFTFGVLYGREEERSRLVQERYERVLRVALR